MSKLPVWIKDPGKGGIDVCKLEQTDWVELPKLVVVDSGAGESVMPENWLPAYETQESIGSRKDEYYVTADGGKVYNQGQKEVVVSTMDGSQRRKMVFQVAAVKKALGSVSQVARNGTSAGGPWLSASRVPQWLGVSMGWDPHDLAIARCVRRMCAPFGTHG